MKNEVVLLVNGYMIIGKSLEFCTQIDIQKLLNNNPQMQMSNLNPTKFFINGAKTARRYLGVQHQLTQKVLRMELKQPVRLRKLQSINLDRGSVQRGLKFLKELKGQIITEKKESVQITKRNASQPTALFSSYYLTSNKLDTPEIKR